MGWRGTILLAFLTVTVAAYVWSEGTPQDSHVGRETLLGEPRNVDPNKAVRHLLTFKPAEVTVVHLEHHGHAIETERVAGKWRGTDNSGAIDDLLQNLTELGVLMDISADPTELKDYGLQPPRSVVRLQVRGSDAPLVLDIGDRNPAVTGVYARIGDNGPVVLAGALAAWEFDKAFRALGGESGAIE